MSEVIVNVGPTSGKKLIRKGGWIIFFSFIPLILFNIWAIFLAKGGMNSIMEMSGDNYEKVQNTIKLITTILALVGTMGAFLGGLIGGLFILIGLIRKVQNK